MIQISDLFFSYSKKSPLLEGLNLRLEAGRIYGLLGMNGEGKSTLLQLISGLSFPQSGAIDVLGQSPQKRNFSLLSNLFFLPEELPSMAISIRRYQKIYSPFYPKFDADLFVNLLTEFGLTNLNANIAKLSYGQKKKVFIAFGLATRADLLLLDEPTNGLDIPSKSHFRKVVAGNLSESQCLIISTHQVRDLDNLIDNVVIINRHKIILNQSIFDISRKLYFGYKSEDAKFADAKTLYSQDDLGGKLQVCENTLGLESKVDVELLFNAVLSSENELTQLFNE